MNHVLNWHPGEYGKGLVHDGAVHTWGVGANQDGTPTHPEYAERAFGLDGDTYQYEEHPMFNTAFGINPEGALNVYDDNGWSLHPENEGKVAAEATAVDPRLYVPEDKNQVTWKFLGVAQDNAIRIIPIEHGGQDSQYNAIPFVYDPTERAIYTGKRGGYHNDLFETLGNDNWNLPQGKLHPPYTEKNPYTDEVEEHPEELQWFSKPPENHEEIHRALGVPPLSGKWAWNFRMKGRVAMPVGEDYWRDFPQRAPFKRAGELYHGTSPTRLESIMQHGIHPWDSPVAGGSNYGQPQEDEDDYNPNANQWLMPRPNHTYMAQNPRDAYDRGLDSSVEDFGPNANPIVFKVDPSYLDPQHINPDEDNMFDKANIRPQEGYNSLGQMAEAMGFGDVPSETERQITQGKHIGYRGVIPPEALTPGHYNEGTWQPIEWPRTASLIGGMRDSCGRYAVAAPWEYGKSGKGLYFPDTGALQTWADDRTHLDVWGDDENYAQGNAHHLTLRSNGTVRDQGSMNRNFEDVEGDTEGLQRALHELDPRLKLDASSNWNFMNVGPTEPMETEPSAVSRGEDGGQTEGVQTSNDYAGSL